VQVIAWRTVSEVTCNVSSGTLTLTHSPTAVMTALTVLAGWCVWVQFGESQKMRLVRILRSTVMVRVGGGWMALDEFLVKNDPCRGTSCGHVIIDA